MSNRADTFLKLRVMRLRLRNKLRSKLLLDKFYSWLSYKVPDRLVYFCITRALSATKAHPYYKHSSVAEISALDVANGWLGKINRK